MACRVSGSAGALSQGGTKAASTCPPTLPAALYFLSDHPDTHGSLCYEHLLLTDHCQELSLGSLWIWRLTSVLEHRIQQKNCNQPGVEIEDSWFPSSKIWNFFWGKKRVLLSSVILRCSAIPVAAMVSQAMLRIRSGHLTHCQNMVFPQVSHLCTACHPHPMVVVVASDSLRLHGL